VVWRKTLVNNMELRWSAENTGSGWELDRNWLGFRRRNRGMRKYRKCSKELVGIKAINGGLYSPRRSLERDSPFVRDIGSSSMIISG
jgi:hypothetical protein